MYLADYHTHSCLSQDGNDTLLEMAAFAQKAGLCELCITDHIECNESAPVGFSTTPKKSYEDFLYTKKHYRGDVKLRLGVEIGQATQNIELAEKVILNDFYDFIIGSLHNCKDAEDFYFIDYKKTDIYPLLDRYYIELMDMCLWGKFDVLGHITYFLRYTAQQGIDVDMSSYKKDIALIMEHLIKHGKGIEVNTTGLRSTLKETSPNMELIKLYKKLGGEIITIGSDAHKKEDVGEGIRETLQLLKAVGFKAYTVFEKRKPIFIDIE